MAEINRTPNPPGSPIEKLISQDPLEEIRDYVRGRLGEGPVTNEELIEVFTFYDEKMKYEFNKQNRILEKWANIHTHAVASPNPRVSGISPYANYITPMISDWIVYDPVRENVYGGTGNGDLTKAADFSSLDVPVWIDDVVVDNSDGGTFKSPDILWSASQVNGLYYHDLTNLPTLTRTLAISTAGQFRGCIYDGENDRLFIVDSTGNTLGEYDVTNPSSPTSVSSKSGVSVNGFGQSYFSYDPSTQHIWASDQSGTTVFGVDASTPGSLGTLYSFETDLTEHRALLAYQGILYILDDTENRVIPIDVSDPSDPVVLNDVSTSQDTLVSIWAQNGYLFIGGGNSGGESRLSWVDTFDTSNLVERGHIDTDGSAITKITGYPEGNLLFCSVSATPSPDPVPSHVRAFQVETL